MALFERSEYLTRVARTKQRMAEKGIEIPFICAGGAVNRSFVESYPLGIYAVAAAQGPGIADKAIEGWD